MKEGKRNVLASRKNPKVSLGPHSSFPHGLGTGSSVLSLTGSVSGNAESPDSETPHICPTAIMAARRILHQGYLLWKWVGSSWLFLGVPPFTHPHFSCDLRTTQHYLTTIIMLIYFQCVREILFQGHPFLNGSKLNHLLEKTHSYLCFLKAFSPTSLTLRAFLKARLPTRTQRSLVWCSLFHSKRCIVIFYFSINWDMIHMTQNSPFKRVQVSGF